MTVGQLIDAIYTLPRNAKIELSIIDPTPDGEGHIWYEIEDVTSVDDAFVLINGGDATT